MRNLLAKPYVIACILFLLALSVRIFLFAHPQQFVFDEVYFINFTSHYSAGTFYFDQHPPLGKLFLYAFAKIIGFSGTPGTPSIGDPFVHGLYVYLRLLPILFGSLIPPLIFFLARKLKISLLASTLIGILLVFENSLISESKFVLIDNFLIVSGFASLLLYLHSLSSRYPFIMKTLAGICLGSAIDIKWTGISFVGMIGLLEIYQLWKSSEKMKYLLTSFFCFCIVPMTIYVSSFAIHFKLLPHSGPGDVFMSQEFNENKLSFTQKFLELNKVMFTTNSTMVAVHPYGTPWYSWPVFIRGIFYWEGKGTESGMIYLMANPFIYWISLMSVFVLTLLGIINKIYRNRTSFILLCGFCANLFPFALITRPMFLYHYLTALIFAIMTLGFVLDTTENKKKKTVIFFSLVVGAIAFFIYFSPLTYGLMTDSVMNIFWFKSWR